MHALTKTEKLRKVFEGLRTNSITINTIKCNTIYIGNAKIIQTHQLILLIVLISTYFPRKSNSIDEHSSYIEHNLSVTDPPIVKMKPENITVNETEDFIVFCDYEANPASLIKVTW